MVLFEQEFKSLSRKLSELDLAGEGTTIQSQTNANQGLKKPGGACSYPEPLFAC